MNSHFSTKLLSTLPRFTGTVALGLTLGLPAMAQRPALNAAAAKALFRPVVAAAPGPVAPEPPQSGQNALPPKDDLFAGTEKFAKGASDVTEISMDPSSLGLVRGDDSHRAQHMVLNVVRTYTYDKPGMFNPADVDEFRRRLEGGDWHCSVHTRDLKNGDSTDVCSRLRAPDMIEHAIITVSPKSLTFIHNIRKNNGQGGGLDIGEPAGLSLWEPDSSAYVFAEVGRALAEAKSAVFSAEMTARMPAMMGSMQSLRFTFPQDLAMLGQQSQELRLNLAPLRAERMRELQQQMQHLQKGLPLHLVNPAERGR